MKYMTKDQKIEWLTKATDTEVIGQLIRSAKADAYVTGKSLREQMEALEDVRLVQDELLKRLGGAK